jgi:hypothetical protein
VGEPLIYYLEGTPLWVYGAFLLVCCYGLSARKTSRESQRSLIITPVVLVVWSLLSLSYADRVELTVGSWFTGMLLGGLVAFALFSRRGLTLDEEGKHLIVPGTWKVFGISLLFFAVKYFIGYQAAVHPEFSVTGKCSSLLVPHRGLRSACSADARGLLLGMACTSKCPWKQTHYLNSLVNSSTRAHREDRAAALQSTRCHSMTAFAINDANAAGVSTLISTMSRPWRKTAIGRVA